MTRPVFKIGDYITFRSPTRWNCAKAKRKIVGLDSFGRPMVRYGGWSNFTVRLHEILEVHPE